MANEKAIYAPGELDKVKQRLGPLDDKEARRMQKLLGGDVGMERTTSGDGGGGGAKGASSGRPSSGGGSGKGKVKRAVDISPDAEENARKRRKIEPKFVSHGKISYFERVKMDRCCGETEFGIKTPWQVFVSRISIFQPPLDYVSPHFIRQNLNEYYRQIEKVVTTVRLLFPKGNAERTLKIKKLSAPAYVILDTLRQWKINQISSEIAKLQARPRAVYAGDCQQFLRDIYRPLYIIEDLVIEIDIEDAFNILYKALFLESPTQETEQSRVKMTEAIAALRYIKNNIRYLLYPLLMKNIADLYCSYDAFFSIYAEQLAAFLGVSPEDKLRPAQTKTSALVDMTPGTKASVIEAESGTEIADLPDVIEQEKMEEAKKESENEAKAVDKGLKTLEMLFPKASWNRLANFPDLFPYFAAVLTFKRGCELISPRDPTQLGLVLSAIIEEMLFGFRSIQFSGRTADEINPVLDEWNYVIDEAFYDAYLRLIDEYVGVLKSSGGNNKGSYAMNLINDIHWARRYYFFPHYDYKSGLPPSFSRKDIRSMFSLARRLRNVLTDVAVSIDAASRAGGASANAICKDIENPWAPYVFEINNPISRRLTMILPKDQRTNVSLIFFTLAAATVLDNLFNSPASIAYTAAEHREVFRSVNDEGHEPILWVDKRTDVDEIFKESLGGRKGGL